MSKIKKLGRPFKFSESEFVTKATNVFYKYGYENSSISILEDEADIARSSLTNSYKNKEGVLLKCLDNYLNLTSFHLLDPLKNTNDNGFDSIMSFWNKLESIALKNKPMKGCFMFNINGELGRLENKKISGRFNTYMASLEESFSAALTRAEKSKTLKNIPPQAKYILITYIAGTSMLIQNTNNTELIKNTFNSLKKLITSWK